MTYSNKIKITSYWLLVTGYLFFSFALPALAGEFQPIEPRLQIPIPNLTFSKILAPDKSGFVYISFLGEYLSALYSYLVGFAGILATVMIVYGGIKWIFAAGDSGKISAAKETINHAVIGLVLALGSYLILYTLNPELVSFRSFKLLSVQRDVLQEIDEGDPLSEGAARPPGTTEPTWTHATFNCASIPPEAGVIPANTTVPIPAELKQIKTGSDTRVHESMLPGLQKLNDTLKEFNQREGVNYTIGISSGYRAYKEQVSLWCGPESNCFKQYKDTAIRKKFCATPGFSNHGQGYAIDVSLFRDGKKITAGNSKTQCTVNDPVNVAKLAEIFYAADPGWKRYEAEIWHFEFNPTETSNRGRYKGLPAKCK